MVRKKGSTLVELCIVMAVLTIVITMTVTFLALMSNRVGNARASDDVLRDLSNVEMCLKHVVSSYDNTDYRLEVGASKQTLYVYDTKTDERVTVMYLNDARDTLIVEGIMQFDIKKVKGLRFSIAQSFSKRSLVQCTTTYEMPNPDDGENTILFTFATHAQGASLRRK